MLIELVGLFIGIILLVKSSDIVVEKSTLLSQITNINSLFIGFIFIAIATSLPELAVTIISSFQGNNLGVSTLFGSNIANITLVFGAMAFFGTYKIKDKNKKNITRAIILTSVVSLLSLFFTKNFIFGLFCFGIFILFTKLISIDKNHSKKIINSDTIKNSLLIFFGIALVIISASIVTESAVSLSRIFNISEVLIGATIVAIGTSLPEVSVSISAIKKKNTELAVGNIIGSLVANLTLIFGIATLINPIVFDNLIKINVILLLVINLFFLVLLKKEIFDKKQSLILISIYFVFLFITSYVGLV